MRSPRFCVVISECTTLQSWLVVCMLDAKWKQTPDSFGETPLQQTVEIFPSCTAKQGGLNALKRALFFFKNSTKLILLPYKGVDFAINDRYFINSGEFSTHMRAKRIKVSWVCAFIEETFMNFLPWSSLCGLCGFISCPHALLTKHAGLSVTNDIARYDGNWFHCMWIKTSSKWCLKIYGQIILLLLVTEGKGKYEYMKLNQSPNRIYVFPVFFPGLKLFLSLNLFIWKLVWFLFKKWFCFFPRPVPSTVCCYCCN